MTQSQHGTDLAYLVILGWGFPAALVSVMFLGGVAALIASALTGGPWAFVLLFLLVVLCLAYGFLYQRAYVVRLSNGVLSWHGCAYQGSRPVRDVEGVTPANAGYVWTFRDGSRMRMMAFNSPPRLRRQAAMFLDEVGKQYPTLSLPGYPGAR